MVDFIEKILIFESTLPKAKSADVFALHIPKTALGKSLITLKIYPDS